MAAPLDTFPNPRPDRDYDIDIRNVVLYWHFMMVTALTTFAVIGLFPLAL